MGFSGITLLPGRRLTRLTLLAALILAGCDRGETASTASPECTRITSAIERLACFDVAAGTPPTASVRQESATQPQAKPPHITTLVDANEADRHPEETTTRITRSADTLPDQYTVVISAPALAGPPSQAYLAISCLSNISRLQLLSAEPLPVNHLGIRLLLDGKPITPARPWQVLEDGTVSDAGRGLVAIEQLRHLTRQGQILQVESDHPSFDGMRFDVSSLAGHMSRQREACHW